MIEERPVLGPRLSGEELLRWYWLHRELAELARMLGISTGGGKQALTARIVACLDGEPLPPPVRGRQVAPPPLEEPLTDTTVIPAGQRCTQQLRRYFTEVVGSSFTFDGPMRDFVAHGAGRTLGDAVAHWHATRTRPAGEIGGQFELNLFIRSWHQRHPGSPRAEALEAWRTHRALPAEARRPP